MTKMQKAYVAKGLKVVGIILYCIAAMVFTVAGSETKHWIMWVGFAMIIAPVVSIAFAMLYISIATAVWHWRLMGICEEEWQSKLLSHWWFWMYRSEKWFDYLKEEIEDDFGDDESVKQKATDFLHALARVKKPRLL